jgi:hypothetical protein
VLVEGQAKPPSPSQRTSLILPTQDEDRSWL